VAQSSDYLFTGTPAIPISSGNKITPLVDGEEFALELIAALDLAVGDGDFILIHSWCLGLMPGKYIQSRYAPWTPPKESGARIDERNFEPFTLTTIGGQTRVLNDVLKQKARDGVDVRVLAWVSPHGFGTGLAQATFFKSYAPINAISCKAILDLRKEPKIGAKAALNALGHTAGATHLKMIVVGNTNYAVGFTGGLDLSQERFCSRRHDRDPSLDVWHDVVTKVEGPVVQSVYDAFQHMWNLNASRAVYRVRFDGADVPTFLPQTPVLPAKTLSTAVMGTHKCQSLRTIPAANYSSLNCVRVPPADPTAPNGLFEVQAAWHNAISKAETYIYMEDQSLWSVDVMSWINARLKEPGGANVKVILIAPGKVDPNDPKFETNMYYDESINKGLLGGLSGDQLDNVHLFKRWAPTTTTSPFEVQLQAEQGGFAQLLTPIQPREEIPQDALAGWFIVANDQLFPVVANPQTLKDQNLILCVQVPTGQAAPDGTVTLRITPGITVHSKTTIVDDKWAIIGSANCMRRSLYTDWEHAIGFIDENGDLAVRDYRTSLWNELFLHGNPADLNDIQVALHAWDPAWGDSRGTISLPERQPGDPGPPILQKITLPLAFTPIDDDHKEEYDVMNDADSRATWGSICDLLRAKL